MKRPRHNSGGAKNIVLHFLDDIFCCSIKNISSLLEPMADQGDQEKPLMDTVLEYAHAHMYPLIVIAVLLVIMVFVWWYNSGEGFKNPLSKKKEESKTAEPNKLKALVDEIHKIQKQNQKTQTNNGK